DRPAGHQSRAGHLLQHRGLLGAAGDTHRLDAGRAASAAPVQEGDGMMLWDEVTVRSRLTGDQRPDDMTVPAHVYTVSGTNPEYPYRPGMMVHSLRATIGPDPPAAVARANDDKTQGGPAPRIDGPPMGRYRRGQVHHWTINLERITG